MTYRPDHDPDDTDRAFALLGDRPTFVRCGHVGVIRGTERRCILGTGHYGLCDYGAMSA